MKEQTIPSDVVQTPDGVSSSWRFWFTWANTIINALVSSGTTAERPTKFLWAGRTYFDTSLGANGKPIWRDKSNTNWIDATGAVV